MNNLVLRTIPMLALALSSACATARPHDDLNTFDVADPREQWGHFFDHDAPGMSSRGANWAIRERAIDAKNKGSVGPAWTAGTILEAQGPPADGSPPPRDPDPSPPSGRSVAGPESDAPIEGVIDAPPENGRNVMGPSDPALTVSGRNYETQNRTPQ